AVAGRGRSGRTGDGGRRDARLAPAGRPHAGPRAGAPGVLRPALSLPVRGGHGVHGDVDRGSTAGGRPDGVPRLAAAAAGAGLPAAAAVARRAEFAAAADAGGGDRPPVEARGAAAGGAGPVAADGARAGGGAVQGVAGSADEVRRVAGAGRVAEVAAR